MITTGAQGRPFVPGDAKIECVSYRRLGAEDDFPGMWEYVYDVVATVDAGGTNYTFGTNVGLRGFDSSLMANRWTDAGELWNGTGNAWEYKPKQNWCANSAGVPMLSLPAPWGLFPDRWPSIWEDVEVSPGVFEEDWVLPTEPSYPSTNWAYDNEWHDGTEYIHGDSFWALSTTGYGIHFINTNGLLVYYGLPGLLMTFRVVHPNAPGDVEWYTYQNNAVEVQGITVGPVIPEPATMSLLALGGLAVLKRRKGKC